MVFSGQAGYAYPLQYRGLIEVRTAWKNRFLVDRHRCSGVADAPTRMARVAGAHGFVDRRRPGGDHARSVLMAKTWREAVTQLPASAVIGGCSGVSGYLMLHMV